MAIQKFRLRQQFFVLFVLVNSWSLAFGATTVAPTVKLTTAPNKPLPAATAPLAKTATATPTATALVTNRSPASREIHEAIDITGQSRNLSMGLLFQRDRDQVSFGSPRTNYKDKITSGQTNY